ncbi:hypothetical protein TPHA_0H02370 [Tetrapisispora phaffii CBS 4417]|uniref:Transcriptional repressor Tup1 N-terminal domain-containing protein n=1 Tax=Tetrapisispora phaffii (strain ATCC 24235 / CBS 4417 / NBRC 1672 / NRRL Y-8282 / UCD 70-5) TaxID=1071381 RepID=G8BWJ0_TETPH|nr:hypothetical protein TPHA_0H02370 [Tetrapisispora phaffii CBS 4417]CCE64441.1 hypothetical protein TPHA_0H02370 [Tetrapisispora phaffii CBS 4417]
MANRMAKLDELLSAISLEYSNIANDANSMAMQNQKGYEFQINQHISELQSIRNKIFELELTHKKMKQSYEEEINRLKLDINQRDNQILNLRSAAPNGHQILHQPPQPTIQMHMSPPTIPIAAQPTIHNTNNRLMNVQQQQQQQQHILPNINPIL